jgi:hypothetical protein
MKIFISYAHEDRDFAAALALALQQRELSIWWDREILAGDHFDATIEREITSADRVIVVWSKHSVVSRWVRAEADYAANEGKLVPIIADGTQPPLSFRLLHHLDFSRWGRVPDSREVEELMRSLADPIAEIDSRNAGDNALEQQLPPGRSSFFDHLPLMLTAAALLAVVAIWTAF